MDFNLVYVHLGDIMQRLDNIEKEEKKILSETNDLFAKFRKIVKDDSVDLKSGLNKLKELRASGYEDLNQLQHEALILQGLAWIINEKKIDQDTQWFWNPRQTGGDKEPDLQGILNGTVVLSAEATSSPEPKGHIDSRMEKTLTKLNNMEGDRFYFVRTTQMKNRANTKIGKSGWNISVVEIE